MVLKKLRAKVKKIVKKVFKKKPTPTPPPRPTPVSVKLTKKPFTPVPSAPKPTTPPRPTPVSVKLTKKPFTPAPGVKQPPTPSPVSRVPSLPKPTPKIIELAKRKRISTVEGRLQKQVVERRLQTVGRELSILRTKRSREKLKKQPTIKTEAKILKLETEKIGLKVVLIPSSFAGFIKALSNRQINFKQIPRNVKEGGKNFGKLLREDPATAFLKVGSEILILKGTGQALKVAGRVTGNTRAVLSTKFKGINPEVIKFASGKGGITTIRVGGNVKKLAEPLGKQIKLAGKKVTGVSAQADRLVNLIKTKRVIRKPIPGEAELPKSTKALLRKFDKRRISKKELITLQNELKRKGQSILERSFFADPRGRFRPSRLGLRQKEASLLDILTGDFTFKASRPQILVFEKTVIEKLPKTKQFKLIKSKLQKGKTLTQTESKELLRFQTKITGKFKPIGALTKEPEITLAPGELIKREKIVGRVIIDGRAVPIVRVSVVKASKKTALLLKKSKRGTIKTKELKALEKRLKKETGFKPRLSRRRVGRRVVRARPLIRPRRRRRPPRRRDAPRRRPPKRRPPRRGRPTPKRRPPGRPVRRRSRRAIRGPPRRGPPGRPSKIGPPIKPFPRRKRIRRRRERPSRQKSFNVFARPLKRTKKGKRPKLVKVNKVPLSKKRAKDTRNFITDTSLSRTARIKPTKGKPKSIRLKVPEGFAKRTSGKFRRFKQVKGKRTPLPKGKVIEKGKFLLDTSQEKKQITLRRRIAQITKPKKIKRKVSQKTLDILKAGREKRLANLKK